MDRQMVYAGSIPLDTDLLNVQRHVLASIGALAQTILGRDPVLDGMACVPGGGPYGVVVGPGSLTVPYVTDARAFAALPPDSAERVRTALQTGNTVLQLGPPPDIDHVVCWLIQAAVVETDAGPIALPYYNAANPTVPFSGPSNSGQAQATQRLLRVVLSAKASAPQVGSGRPPAPDAGYAGLYKVTTYFGKPQIAAADIAPLPAGPQLRFKLPALPPGFTQLETFDNSGTWTVPTGVRHIRVRLVGGGGGGGGGSTGFSGGGGGAGGYAEDLLTVFPGDIHPITVGVGGNPGGSGVSGSAGSNTAFGSVVTATGGEGGGSANPDSHGGAPGVGAAGKLLLHGGYGSDGAVIGQVPAGNGGASALGGGGRGSNQGGLPAFGQAKGGGGGGGYGANSTGGGGASGLVIIEY